MGELLREPRTGMIRLTDREFKEFVGLVYRGYGIDLSKKQQIIEGRLSNTLRDKGMSSFAQYMQCLLADKSGEEMQMFLNKITTNHSFFAREEDHFHFLMDTALPFLTKRRKGDLRIWSAGCSAGQEAYNIAMAIDQYFGSRKLGWDTTILATDISMDVLGKAKLGIYPGEQLKGLSPTLLQKYFKPVGDGSYQICEAMRKEVVFRTFNLMDPFVYKKPFDIIFCRNVMIYFDEDTTARVVRKFYQATAPGGFFFIGHSESLRKDRGGYNYLKPAVYQKGLGGETP